MSSILPNAAPAASAAALSADETLALMQQVRERTLALISHLDQADLERSHSPIMSPLAWDLAHIGAYEDLWLCRRLGGLPLHREDLAELYDAFETPRAVRADRQAGFLDAPGALEYLAQVRERSTRVITERAAPDGYLLELVIRHELQHTETMRQTMALAGLLAAGDGPELRLPGAAEPLRWIDFAGGPTTIGADHDGFAYDNERPAHSEQLAPFQIAERPLGNDELRAFQAADGYRDAQLWSEQGRRWLADQDIDLLSSAIDLDPGRCLCHVNWHEAQALAGFFGARLPTERECEHAMRSGIANTGLVWEWTSDEFTGYEGFRAFPYREYSEVFFNKGYRVLRGSSWATDRRLGGVSFRNWDLPERRQIFAGVRLARDMSP